MPCKCQAMICSMLVTFEPHAALWFAATRDWGAIMYRERDGCLILVLSCAVVHL